MSWTNFDAGNFDMQMVKRDVCLDGSMESVTHSGYCFESKCILGVSQM